MSFPFPSLMPLFCSDGAAALMNGDQLMLFPANAELSLRERHMHTLSIVYQFPRFWFRVLLSLPAEQNVLSLCADQLISFSPHMHVHHYRHRRRSRSLVISSFAGT
jgi:hypothetical protein